MKYLNRNNSRQLLSILMILILTSCLKQVNNQEDFGEIYQDCDELYCPNMVVIPAGSFKMGGDAFDDEKPIHTVNVREFMMSETEVTKHQFAVFVNATGFRTDAEKNTGSKQGCYTYKGGTDFDWSIGASWLDPGFSQKDTEPVVCISWNDAKAYIKWLSKHSGKLYRLPSESEWEYAADMGGYAGLMNQCDFVNGADTSTKRRFDNLKLTDCNDGYVFTSPVKSFKPNSLGLYDMNGNVWEWVEDKWHDNYKGAPSDGSAWNSGHTINRVYRGGSWDNSYIHFRHAYRGDGPQFDRTYSSGFRLALDK